MWSRFRTFTKRLSSPTATRVGTLGVFLAAFLLFIVPAARTADLNAAPEPGDGPDYDNMAMQLSKGNGFSFDWEDPDFRAPYEAANTDGRYDYLLDRQGAWTTALKSPLFPFLMGTVYKVFGRQFGLIRVINSSFLALAVAIAFLIVARRLGAGPAILCGTLLVFDYGFPVYATLILTEAVACLCVMIMFWSLLRAGETRLEKWACILGIVTGIAFLARSPFVIWVPVLVIPLLVFARPPGIKIGFHSLGPPALFMATFLLVAGPWMIRNCVVLRGFEPLGTASADLPTGFSDEAMQNKGVWVNLFRTRAAAAKPGETRYYDRQPTEGATLTEQELIRSRRGKAEAAEWVFDNPGKLPLLTLLKIWSEWRPHGKRQTLLLVFAALGLAFLFWRARREAVTYLCILVAGTLSIGVTWSVGGRFLVPVLPVVIALSSIGMWSLVVLVSELIEGRKRMVV